MAFQDQGDTHPADDDRRGGEAVRDNPKQS